MATPNASMIHYIALHWNEGLLPFISAYLNVGQVLLQAGKTMSMALFLCLITKSSRLYIMFSSAECASTSLNKTDFQWNFTCSASSRLKSSVFQEDNLFMLKCSSRQQYKKKLHHTFSNTVSAIHTAE